MEILLMKFALSSLIAILILGTLYSTSAHPQKRAVVTLSDHIDEALRNRIEAAGFPPKIMVRSELILASVMLPIFYERRAYKPAWCDENGPSPHGETLLLAIRLAYREGLRPNDYHLASIEATLAEIKKNRAQKKLLNLDRLVDLDLLLTDAFLIYGSHLLAGRINPETIDPEWFANRREADLAAVLQSALDSTTIEESLHGLLPPQAGYARLRQALARYRDIAAKGGWPTIPEGPKLQVGDRNERVVLLRSRLSVTGDLASRSSNDEELFDYALGEAVRSFQKRNGLESDGVVGPKTLSALNIPAEERVRQMEINMERWRWLPQDLGDRYILINIANFELDVLENNTPVMTMRIVVGRSYRRTPVFSDKMTYLVLNPYWNVPTNIAIEDIVPQVSKDPNYLAQKNMKVFRGWGADTKEIDPTTIDWSKVSKNNFAYRFRQEPGSSNALGRIKFMFPNRFNVYLHDTPSRELFEKNERTFSSGCIRIEKPLDLAEYVMRGDPLWSREKILVAIERHVEQTVRLPKPLSIHLLYWTAWANEDETVQFRNDIYGRDTLVDAALRENPPSP
jgi:murein L,D-transpeptidase YcbB/YkuD